MKKNLIFLIIGSFFLLSCSTKEVIKEKKSDKYNVISLNVYEFKMVFETESFKMPTYLGFDKQFLFGKLNEWGNKKFKVKGAENSLSLIVNEFSLEKKNVKKYKGLRKIFFSDEKVEYNLKLKLSLKFVYNTTYESILNLNGNISFFIDDSHSISKKRKLLLISYQDLIKKIDKTLESELDKKTFSKFKTTL